MTVFDHSIFRPLFAGLTPTKPGSLGQLVRNLRELYPLRYRWHRPPDADRIGQACRIVTRGRRGTVLVEFADGFRMTTSWRAVRRAKS